MEQKIQNLKQLKRRRDNKIIKTKNEVDQLTYLYYNANQEFNRLELKVK